MASPHGKRCPDDTSLETEAESRAIEALEKAMKEKPMHLDLVTTSGTGDA